MGLSMWERENRQKELDKEIRPQVRRELEAKEAVNPGSTRPKNFIRIYYIPTGLIEYTILLIFRPIRTIKYMREVIRYGGEHEMLVWKAEEEALKENPRLAEDLEVKRRIDTLLMEEMSRMN